MKSKKSRIVLSILILILISLLIFILNFNRIRFEYYAWHLSSESISEREIHAEKITKMGGTAVPLLIEKLDHRYIFETQYIINSLEKNIGTDKDYPKSQVDQIVYWKKWWSDNKQKF